MTSYRNNIVSKLMDRVPARHKEGYQTPSSGVEGLILLIELASPFSIYDEIDNHRLLSGLPYIQRKAAADVMIGALEWIDHPDGDRTCLLKLRAYDRTMLPGQRMPNYWHTMVDLRDKAIMYALYEDGKHIEINSMAHRSKVLTVDDAIARAATMQTVACFIDDHLEIADYDPTIHAVMIEGA